MTEEGKQPKRKRRWLRFNLRSFLIVVTILGAVIGPYVYRAEKQRTLVHWVQKNGGIVVYGFEAGRGPNDPSLRSKWLHKIFGVDYFECVVAVYLNESQVSDLTPLAGLSNLEQLLLLRLQVNKEEIAALQQALPNCRINHD